MKKISSIVIDSNKESILYINKTLDRLGIKRLNLENTNLLKEIIKKNVLGKLNYNTVFLANSLTSDELFNTIKMLRDLYGNRIHIIVIAIDNDLSLASELYMLTVDMVISITIMQSYLFNWYNKITKGKLIVNNGNYKDYDFTGKTIMVVEDNELNMEIITELLKLVNINIIKASNGREAVDLFINSEEKNIDIILMDINMPVMDGIEATRQIRNSKHSYGRIIPIIALTANSLPKDVEMTIKAGMNECLFKPLKTKSVYEIIKRYL